MAFCIMINDLDVNTPHLWKCFDDTTASEVVPKGNTSNAQSIVNQVIEWSRANRVQLNPEKCKELRISFARNPVELDTLVIDGKEVEVVSTAKLLGLTISANLTWNTHIEEVLKKARKRLYFLVQLKRAKLPPTDLILFSIIMPDTSYNNACEILGESPKVDRIDSLCDKLCYSITSGKDPILGDPGTVSRVAGILVGESRTWAKVYSKNETKVYCENETNQFQKRFKSPLLIGQKNIFLPNQRRGAAG